MGIAILALTLILMVSGSYYFLSATSGFQITSSSASSAALLQEHKTIFYGYGFDWTGYGTPTIENIYVVQKDGIIHQQSDAQIAITPFIDASESIGVMDGAAVIEDGIMQSLIPVQGFSPTARDFSVAFKVDSRDEHSIHEFQALIIEYRYLGQMKKQSMDFNGFFGQEPVLTLH